MRCSTALRSRCSAGDRAPWPLPCQCGCRRSSPCGVTPQPRQGARWHRLARQVGQRIRSASSARPRQGGRREVALQALARSPFNTLRASLNLAAAACGWRSTDVSPASPRSARRGAERHGRASCLGQRFQDDPACSSQRPGPDVEHPPRCATERWFAWTWLGLGLGLSWARAPINPRGANRPTDRLACAAASHRR